VNAIDTSDFYDYFMTTERSYTWQAYTKTPTTEVRFGIAHTRHLTALGIFAQPSPLTASKPKKSAEAWRKRRRLAERGS
jgi:hypothetical protein